MSPKGGPSDESPKGGPSDESPEGGSKDKSPEGGPRGAAPEDDLAGMDPDSPPPGRLPEGGLLKRSLVIAGHRTSVSLEAAFWEALRRLAAARGLSIQALVGRIDAERGEQNLSSAIRVFVLRAVWPGEDSAGPADIRREAQPVRG